MIIQIDDTHYHIQCSSDLKPSTFKALSRKCKQTPIIYLFIYFLIFNFLSFNTRESSLIYMYTSCAMQD